ncbi:MAG: hypothetical protein Ta2A_02890 [Treponemataceae bacterium]|nr:MAG: hypothetical protein Ta2A_02890 [Treponemataceae bacterium]
MFYEKEQRRIRAPTSLLRKLWAGCGGASVRRVLVLLAGSGCAAGCAWLNAIATLAFSFSHQPRPPAGI